jgi:hypothetical protein
MHEVLYHYQLGFPSWFRALDGEMMLVYGSHARREAMLDRYGLIELPDSIDLADWTVIEIGVQHGEVTKYVLRSSLDTKRDLVLVVRPNGFVKTVWTNLKDDVHRTLNTARYERVAA